MQGKSGISTIVCSFVQIKLAGFICWNFLLEFMLEHNNLLLFLLFALNFIASKLMCWIPRLLVEYLLALASKSGNEGKDFVSSNTQLLERGIFLGIHLGVLSF